MDQIPGDSPTIAEFLREAELLHYLETFRETLKVTKLSQLKYVISDDLDQIGMSKPEQRCYKKVYSKYFPNNYLSKLKKLLTSKKTEVVAQTYETVPVVEEMQPFNENNVKVPTKHIIPVEDITINKELGMGQFGVVQQGTWVTGNQRVQVAIKCLGNEKMTSNSIEFLKEAAVMHSIEHPNIVRLYGVVLHMDSLMLVTELAPLRSLLECLREIPLRPNFPVPTLCDFAEQICYGMTYLEKKRLIHRDLAARNILVFSKDKVKISDFGLSRALGVGKDYYQTNYNVNLKLPVAWCAPECILYLRFTSGSDVWAFAVCLWEMFTYGFQPWAAFSGQQILETIDAPNCQRLERPECCPEAYYATMLECWSHEPSKRPKFKELSQKLRDIRPELVQATVNCPNFDGKRNSYLEYRSGQIITVLGKENMTHSSMWYGVLPCGTCGVFDPNNTKPCAKQRTASLSFHTSASMSPNPLRSSGRLSETLRPAMMRSDTKRHTYTGKRTIQRSMISSPQGDIKHTGHIGLDGAYFGDISFLDPASCPPKQIVTPYKPSEDLEEVPLINPNSPSHLTGAASIHPYPLLRQEVKATETPTRNERIGCQLEKPTLPKKPNLRLSTAAIAGPSQSKMSTLGRPSRLDDQIPTTSAATESHEYHEIMDTIHMDRELDNIRCENYNLPESPSTPKSSSDFSQSLLEEIDSMFKTLNTRGRRDEHTAISLLLLSVSRSLLTQDPDRQLFVVLHCLRPHSERLKIFMSNFSNYFTRQPYDEARSQTLLKPEKRKGFISSTMKPMSAHDKRTLDIAVALANEITTRSMNDLEIDVKMPNSPSERAKFHFKFPLVSSLSQHTNPIEIEKDIQGKQERRNFSEEANSVPDIQSTLTAESKLAYKSLIEQPSLSSSLIPHITKDNSIPYNPRNHVKPVIKSSHCSTLTSRSSIASDEETQDNARGLVTHINDDELNEIPLPPRTTKPKLVDKPRHVRKYPLIMPNTEVSQYDYRQIPFISPVKPKRTENNGHKNIYQNFENFQEIQNKTPNKKPVIVIQYQNLLTFDVCDGVVTDVTGTTSSEGASARDDPNSHLNSHPSTSKTVNPFIDSSKNNDDSPKSDMTTSKDNEDNFEKGTLSKDSSDHVSVEDLLEFADQKPCGRQRGVESDEVRIMTKVLQQGVSPSNCLDALEISNWNVHHAIKMIRVKNAASVDVTLEECSKELEKCNGDILKATNLLNLKFQQNEN